MSHWMRLLIALVAVELSDADSLPECYEQIGFSRNICEAMMADSVLHLIDFFPLKLITPQDAAESCNTYKQHMNCSVLVRAQEGQRIMVSTGETYQLERDFCSTCDSCDSYKVDETCIRPDLPASKDVLVSKSSWTTVQFTSLYSNGKPESMAQISLRAFGCPSKTLVTGKGVVVEIVGEQRLLPETEVYTVKVTCQDGSKIWKTTNKEMLVLCKRRHNVFEYYWDHSTDELLSCPDSKARLAGIIIAVILVLVILIILLGLFCLRKLPCQNRDEKSSSKKNREGFSPLRRSKRKPVAKRSKGDVSKRYDNIEDGNPQQLTGADSMNGIPDDTSNAGGAEAMSIRSVATDANSGVMGRGSNHSVARDTSSNHGRNADADNRSSNLHNEALVAAEVAQYWNVTRNRNN